MGNLSHYAGGGGSSQHGGNHMNSPGGGGGGDGDTPEHGGADDGYASEDFVKGSSSSCRERKKGLPFFRLLFQVLFMVI